jgi:hypothetical protein
MYPIILPYPEQNNPDTADPGDVAAYTAALDLIREGDLYRELHAVGRDTDTDHLALNDARARYDTARRTADTAGRVPAQRRGGAR